VVPTARAKEIHEPVRGGVANGQGMQADATDISVYLNMLRSA
jgi:hypothetical protein